MCLLFNTELWKVSRYLIPNRKTLHLLNSLLISTWLWFCQERMPVLRTHWKLIEVSPRLDVCMQCTTIIKATGEGNRSQISCLLGAWVTVVVRGRRYSMSPKYQGLYDYLSWHADRSRVLLYCLEGIKEIKADMKTFFNIWQHFFCRPHSRVGAVNVQSIYVPLLTTSSSVF